ADDWRHINAAEVVRRAITRLDEKGKGILLLHDIQPATALALPELFRELKAKGYRIVQVVPGRGATPPPVAEKTEPAPAIVLAQDISAPAAPKRDDGEQQPAQPVQKQEDGTQAQAQASSAKPAVSHEAADSLARAEEAPQEPVRPFTSGAKPARNMPTPGK